MTDYRDSVRTVLSGAVLTCVAATAVVLHSAPAQANAGCTDGSRADARSLADSGDFTEFGTTNTGFSEVTLRVSASANCAWGLISGVGYANNARVWLDRSRDGGTGWDKSGVWATGFTKRSTYTGAYSLDGYNAVRACTVSVILTAAAFDPKSGDGAVVGDYFCTPWR